MGYEMTYYTYIMTNKMNTVLYVGVTNDIERRSFEHKSGIGGTFTSRYNCKKLVYYEEFDSVNDAIDREKELKGWSRKKKEILINKDNRLWEDLSQEWHEDWDKE
jgi:putative endonuclease